jgi:acetoin utilization deacetylase AcuC-like enzyme
VHIITDKRCAEFSRPGHVERPARITRAVETLRQQKELAIHWQEPATVTEDQLLRAHLPRHLERLKQAVDFDADTPAYPGIAEHARRAVGGGLRAMEFARQKQAAFSLMRPPGHHATRDRAMGFCYLNTMAIAVREALATGIAKVAVYDFDLHHCNGTEELLLDQPGCAVFSIHQFPAYPGTGAQSRRNCHNYPVPPRTPALSHRAVLEKALKELKRFGPELVAVSAGFDAFRGDPIGDELLEREDYHWLGQAIGALGLPTFSILEGGYSEELPELVLGYLKGLEGKPAR